MVSLVRSLWLIVLSKCTIYVLYMGKYHSSLEFSRACFNLFTKQDLLCFLKVFQFKRLTYECCCHTGSPDWRCRWAGGWWRARRGRKQAQGARWQAGRLRPQSGHSPDWGDLGRSTGKDWSSGRPQWPPDSRSRTLLKPNNKTKSGDQVNAA